MLTAMRGLALLVLFVCMHQPRLCSADGVALPRSYLAGRGARACGWMNGKWAAGSLRKGLFHPFTGEIIALRAQLAASPARGRAALRRRIALLQARNKEVRSAVCRKLRNRPKLVTNLLELPSMSALTGAARTLNSGAQAISGEPPAAAEIPNLQPKSLFWRAGFIDQVLSGLTPEQCSEFQGGLTDGASGGFTACMVVEASANAFAPLTRGATNLCYLRHAIAQQYIDAGAVKVVRGDVPAGGIREIFTPPGGDADRVIAVTLRSGSAGDEQDFIRVFAEAPNKQQGLMYRYAAWRCYPGNELARSFELSEVNNDQGYDSRMAIKDDDGDFDVAMSGRLASDQDGKIAFDAAFDRRVTGATILKNFLDISGKFDAAIGVDGLLRIKLMTRLLGSYSEGTLRTYGAIGFSGNDVSDLRVLEAAHKDQLLGYQAAALGGRFAMEWRGSYYAAAPDSVLLPGVDEVDFDSDAFYAQIDQPDIDMSPYRCDQNADLAIEIDLANNALREAAAECDAAMLRTTAYCIHDPVLFQVDTNWLFACNTSLPAS